MSRAALRAGARAMGMPVRKMIVAAHGMRGETARWNP